MKAEDLIQYGFESEFIGRLPVVTVFEHLETEDLYKILRNPKSPIVIGKKRDFKAYGIDLQFEDEALRRIAENAAEERTGARGLVSAVERVLMKFEHTLPSTDHLRHLVVTPAMSRTPRGELKKILEKPGDPERERRFHACWRKRRRRWNSPFARRKADLLDEFGVLFRRTAHRLITHWTIERRTDLDAVGRGLRGESPGGVGIRPGFPDRTEVQMDFSEEAIDRFAERTWAKKVWRLRIASISLSKLRTRFEADQGEDRQKKVPHLGRGDGEAGSMFDSVDPGVFR